MFRTNYFQPPTMGLLGFRKGSKLETFIKRKIKREPEAG